MEPNSIDRIFCEAAQIDSEDERAAYLANACGDRPDIRRKVELLLLAKTHAENFLESPPAAIAATNDETTIPERPGTVIGTYKLLEQIGEGGFGVVFMAEQTEPVRRKVAFKVLKPGMDTRQVVARFEAERQALAIMDHPNIARVFDGGATASGRPFFVMELVKGLPITDYCDQNHLTPRQRLELFLAVCHAVQHAHQKGIIHRDLKPSNVLVAVHDTTPVVKVIDFGVAKAMGQELTDKTLFTAFAQMIGTPLYMSPEQAGQSNLDIDTRSDIYSLGVLLYELLTGTTPFDKQRFKQAAYDEIRRIIRDEEPPKPSTRLSSTDALPSIAANRGLEPMKLARQVRGELDWIVMKALEKDRNRRYETANSVVMDVQRYLADEPVLACPPSVGYRLRKFLRRNKRALVAAVVLGGAILVAIGAVAGSIGWVAHEQATRQLVLEQEVGHALEESEDWYGRDKLPEAMAALKRAEGLLATAPIAHELRQRVRQWRADLEMVNRLDEARLERTAVKDDQFDWRAEIDGYREAFHRYGLEVDQLEPEQAAKCIRASAVSDRLVVAVDEWARRGKVEGLPETDRLLAVAQAADSDTVRKRIRKIWWEKEPDAAMELACDEHVLAQAPATISMLAVELIRTGQPSLAVAVMRQAQQRHTSDFWINAGLAQALAQVKPPRYDEAIAFYRVAVALRPDSPGVRHNLGGALIQSGELAHAVAELKEAVRLKPDYANAHAKLGETLAEMGNRQGALAALREAIRLKPDSDSVRYRAGNTFRQLRMPDEAIAEYREVLRLRPNYANVHIDLGAALSDKGLSDEAIAEYRTAIRLNPDLPQPRGNLAGELVTKGLIEEAVAEARELIRRHPDYAPAYHVLGQVAYAKGDWDEAIAQYSKATELHPKVAAAHVGLGMALEIKGLLDLAIAAYRQAIRLKPDFALAYTNLGILLKRKGLLDEASTCFRKAIELDPKSAPSSVGRALRALGQFDDAIAVYREALRLCPDDVDAYMNLGNALSDKGLRDEAIAEYQTAIRLRPDLPGPRSNLASELIMKGAIDEAVVEARELVRRYPDYAPGYYALGWVATRKGDWDEAVTQFGNAITQFGQATELDPKFADAHTSLGYALQRKGLPDQAIAAYHRAIRLKPDSALTHSNLGWSLISKGLADEAITSFRKAIELDPKYAPAYEGLGNALRSQEKLDEAIAEYRQATELDPKYGSAHRQLCDALRNQGKLEEARVVWERALESDPPDHDAWYGYAELCLFLDNEDAYRRNRTALLQRFGKTTDPVVAERTSRACLSLAAAGEELEQAVALADRAVTLGQDHEYYNFFMAAKALAEYRLGRCESALDWGKKAVERGVSIPTHLVLAMAHQRLGHAENARRSLVDGLNSHDWDKSSDGIMRALRREAEGLIAHLPAFLDGWYEPRATPAGELLKRGLIDEAASEARAIIRDHPDSAPPYFTLGQVASIKSEWDKAIAKFSKALELDPEFAEAHAGVGNALEKKGLLDQAIDAYRQAIRVKPDFALAHHNLGLVLDRQGLPHEAFEAYLQALRLEPGNAERRHRIDQAVHSLNNMAWGLATNPDPALRDASRAVKLAKEAVELRPENGAIWNTLGIAHYRTNNCEEAIAALEESIKLRNGGDGYDWFFLAMAHWQLGHREEARKWYDRAVGWFDAPGWHDKDVPRFHVEAAELLGVDDDYVRIARARLHICHSRWEQAAGEYASVTNLLPIRNCDVWSEHACLRLLVNDNEGYRQFCRQVIDHAGRTDDPFTAFVLARACAVSAEPVVEPERLVGWARQAADAEPMAPGRLHILGLAYYRAGKFESAVECADRSAKAGWQNSAEGALNELVLALSHHRMGHTAEARTWLAKARKRVEQFTPAAALLSQVPSPDWVEIQLLRLEAEELLKTE